MDFRANKEYEMIQLKINLFGVLRKFASNAIIEINLEEPATVESLLNKLSNNINGFNNLYKNQKKGIESGLIIVINNKEISVLNGFRTFLKNGDMVDLIPIIHGG